MLTKASVQHSPINLERDLRVKKNPKDTVDKGTKRWAVSIEGEEHKVILYIRETWDGAGELWVDGKLVDSWKSNLRHSPHSFRTGETDAVLNWQDKRCKLYVAGEFIRGELVSEHEATIEGATSDKGTKRWAVPKEGEGHKVILYNRESWDGAGELWVDGKLVDSWKSNLRHSPHSLRIGETDAVLDWQDKRCKLYVAGEFIRGELVSER